MPGSKPHDQWLNEHIDSLLEITRGRPLPAGESFRVRSWTWLKLAALDYYIPIYLRILRPRYQRLVFLDLFAGSGEGLYTDGRVALCAPGSSLVAASYRQRSANPSHHFDELYCIEANAARAASLRDAVGRFGYREGVDLSVKVTDANTQADAIVSLLSQPRTHALLFGDPEGLHLYLSTLTRILKGHLGTDAFITHLNAGAARGSHPLASPARDAVYGAGAWHSCRTREDFTLLYQTILGQLKDVVIPIPIKGDFDAPGYQYDLFFAVRKTSTGSGWTRSVERLDRQVRSLSGQDVKRVLRTRTSTMVGGKKTRQIQLG